MSVSLDCAIEQITFADILRAAATLADGTKFFFPTAKSVVWIGKEAFHPKALIALAARRHLVRELTPADVGPSDNRRIMRFFADCGFKVETFGTAPDGTPSVPS